MVKHRHPATAAMLAVLSDGEWHDRDELVAAGADVVPPGEATRAARTMRVRRAQRRRADGVPEQPNQARRLDDVTTGSREIARRRLKDLARKGRVERDSGRYRAT